MTTATERLKVVLVDDHPMVREGLRAVLEHLGGADVVGEAGDGDEAIRVVAATGPDVVVMDLTMPGLSGIEATRRLVDRDPRLGVLVLTMSEDDASVFAALRAGARGYVLKGATGTELVSAVQTVARGEAVYGAAVAGRIRRFLTEGLEGAPVDAGPFPELTAREREILDLLADGHANAEIARKLFLSPKTVRNIVSSVYAKLQVADRAQAVVRARQAGLGSP
jgi:DNA-binding NarL/FixJ family response regulator